MQGQPLIVFPDTHGHLKYVEIMVRYFKDNGYLDDHRLAFLGDYPDRGPQIRELLDYFIELQKQGHIFLMGNHDYVLDRIMSDDKKNRDQWIERWAKNYEDNTLESYGVRNPINRKKKSWFEAADVLKQAMPDDHKDFLASLPYIYENEDLILVHAGLESDISWKKQQKALLARQKNGPRGPNQIFSHDLARSLDNPAPKRLVSAHAVFDKPIVLPNRVMINLGIDYGGPLIAWISDTNTFFKVSTRSKSIYPRGHR